MQRFAATVLFALFLVSGLSKLSLPVSVVAFFASFGLPAIAVTVVGVWELGIAALLVRPTTRPYGALLACPLMAGAALAHVLTGVARGMLIVNVGLFVVAVWLVMHQRPSFLRIDWGSDPHRH